MSEQHAPNNTPIAIKASSMTLSVITIAVIAICLDRFVRTVGSWKQLSLPQWTLFAFYCLSFLFSSSSAVIKDLEPNSSRNLCQASIFICLFFYLSAKILQYHFLVERAHLIRSNRKSRLKDKLYLFNCVFLILPYIALVIFNFYWRIGYINADGVCINGLEMLAIIPLIAFEVFINVYMTGLFLFPFRKIIFKRQSLESNSILQALAYRTAIATGLMILATVGNLVGLLVMHGEPGWLCFMCCTADVAFCVLMLHWVTKNDRMRRGFSFSEELTQGLKLWPDKFDDCVMEAFCRASRMVTGVDREPNAEGQIRVTKTLKFEVNGHTVNITTTPANDDDDDDKDSITMRGPQLSRHGTEDSIIEMELGLRGSKDQSKAIHSRI